MPSIKDTLRAVDPGRLQRDLYYLANDPLPCRTINCTLPGHDRCTLYEADDFILEVLRRSAYQVSVEAVRVQSFVAEPSAPWGFRKPLPEEPWGDAFNILALKKGHVDSKELVVVMSHKDSQSWLEFGPGALDNAVGVAALLELSRILSNIRLDRSLMFLFCNEEHWPWTSVEAARRLAASEYDVAAALNVDSIGGMSPAERLSGRRPNVIRFSTPEGERLADRILEVNERFQIGLDQRKVFSETPNDDDGSFINAGISPVVLLIGSYPYADPNYHTVHDTPDKVDIETVVRATQLALATVMTLCGVAQTRRVYRPEGSIDPSGL